MTSILHLTRNTSFRGGGPMIMSNLIRGLSEYEHAVGGILTKRSIREAEGSQHGINLVNCCALPTSLDLIFALRSYRLCRLASKVLKLSFPGRMHRRFGSYGFGLVHSHYSNEIDRQAKAILEYLKVPMLWTAHSVPSEGRHEVSRQLRKFNAICRRHPNSVSVVAVSQSVKTSLQALCPDVPIELIYNGAEVNHAEEVKRADFLCNKRISNPNPFVICSVGRLNPEKGIEYLILAARRVVSENERAVFIHLGEGYLQPRLLKLVDEYGLKDRFFFLGHKPDVGAYLRMSDLFVLPSLNEAFGLSLLEALTVGLPSVVSNVGGVPEVTGPESSVFVSPADAPAISDAIVNLMRDPHKRALMSSAALKQSKKFSMSRMISGYRCLYERLLANSLRKRDTNR